MMILGASLTLSAHIRFSQANNQKQLHFSAIASLQEINSAVQALTSQSLSSLLPDGTPSLVATGSTVPSLEFVFICVGSGGDAS